MKRRLFTILCALSALLSLCIAAVWIRSYWKSDYLSWERTRHHPKPFNLCISWGMKTARGSLVLARSLYPDLFPHRFGPPGTSHMYLRSGEADDPLPMYAAIRGSHAFCGFAFCRMGYNWPPYDYLGTRAVVLPLWSLMLITLLPPARWVQLRYLRHRHRLRLNLCPTCSYDLRASTDRCPECGEPIPAPGVKTDAS